MQTVAVSVTFVSPPGTARLTAEPWRCLLRTDDLDALSVNTIRTLCIDAVQAANSGHPGTPMAMAPVVYTLWTRFLRFDPEDPIWPEIGRASCRERV